MILVWLLEANYTLNILAFLYWWQIILGTFPGGQVADTYHMFSKYSWHSLFTGGQVADTYHMFSKYSN